MTSGRRRIWSAGALALALVAAGLGVAWWVRRPDTTQVPATKRAIAAVVLDHLGISPSSYGLNQRYDVPVTLGVRIAWHPGGDSNAHYLDTAIVRGREADRYTKCFTGEDCDHWASDGGTMYLSWQRGAPEEDPGLLHLTYLTDDGEARDLRYAGTLITGDPRDQDDLPVSIEDMEGVVTDPRYSATTTQEMADTRPPKWPEYDAAGDPVRVSQRVLGEWMRADGVTLAETAPHAADVSAYGPRAIGRELVSPGRTTTVVLVPNGDPATPTCGPAWHCEVRSNWYEDEVVVGWRPGVAIVIRPVRGATFYGTVRAGSIDGFPRPAGRYGKVGADFEGLAGRYSDFGLTTTREYANDVR